MPVAGVTHDQVAASLARPGALLFGLGEPWWRENTKVTPCSILHSCASPLSTTGSKGAWLELPPGLWTPEGGCICMLICMQSS